MELVACFCGNGREGRTRRSAVEMRLPVDWGAFLARPLSGVEMSGGFFVGIFSVL